MTSPLRRRPPNDVGLEPHRRAAHPVGAFGPTPSCGAPSSAWRSSSAGSGCVGAEKLPADGAFVLAPVHRSNVDFALTAILTTRPMRYMGKDSIWKSERLGRFVSMLGAFPVHRGSADRESLRACVEIIEGGSPLVMFPEGTRKAGPIVEDLFDGTTYVASKTDVPIVPLGIGGSEAMMPKGARFLKRSQLVLIVGDPIPAPPRDASGRVPRHAVREMTEALQERLQALFDEATKCRPSRGR